MKILRNIRTQNDAPALSEADARELLNRFFEGETTLTEEHRLATYLRRDDAPADMRRYSVMIGWLDDGMPSAVAKQPRRRLIAMWGFACSTAAMLAIVATLCVSYFRAVASEHALYDGSFIVENGHRITDIDEIMPQLRRVETLAMTTPEDPVVEFVSASMDDDMRRSVSEILDY